MQQNFTEKYAGIWENCSSEMPEFSKSYSESDKLDKEQILDQFLGTIKTYRKKHFKRESIHPHDQEKFLRNTRSFLSNGLDFTSDQLDMMFSDQMIELTKSFVRQAKSFDPDLTFPDIFQACRNMWIMNGLQLIMGIHIQVTPSIFAYSLLYPYTDNLIDDPQISGFEKMAFSERFRNRLSGISIIPENKTENAIFRLVGMIEEEYSRKHFPEVYESLLGIHDAQTKSVKLIQDKTITEDEILKICIAKGGTSVLADGYLVAGKLTDTQRNFLFGYGAYLQLLDDIQDLEDDHNAGLKTVFSNSAFRFALDKLLNKTYWFGEQVMKSIKLFDGKHLDLFESLMRRSMDLFIAEAIAQNPEAYSQQYMKEFEASSPFHFSYIRKRKEQFKPYNGFLLTLVEEIALKETVLAASQQQFSTSTTM